MEIFNANTTNPDRVCALLGFLKNYSKGISKKEIEALFMPTVAPAGNLKLITEVVNTVEQLGLISQTSGVVHLEKKTLKPNSTKAEIRTLIMDSILAARQQEDNNYSFSLFFSWLIARIGIPGRQGQKLVADQIRLYPPAFNKEMGDKTDERLMNDVKFPNFVGWASFLGLGYEIPNLIQKNRRNYFVPYPVTLIENQLKISLADKKELPMPEFIKALGKKYPFLDGGSVFNAIPPDDGLKDQITPTVSKILRSLHDEKIIILEPPTDTAKKPTTLFEDDAHKIHSVARVKLGSRGL